MTVNDTQLSERAYALWEQHGKPDCRALEFWLMAEAELADKATLSDALEDSFLASDPPSSLMGS